MDQHNLQYVAQQLEQSRIHKRELFKAHTKLTDADFEAMKFLEHSLVIDAATAKGKGIVQDVSLPPVPAGVPIINVDY